MQYNQSNVSWPNASPDNSDIGKLAKTIKPMFSSIPSSMSHECTDDEGEKCACFVERFGAESGRSVHENSLSEDRYMCLV